ncbi:MAG: ATP-binding protein [Sphaerochaetaceae bacterium]|jgi:two-component system phosphate regulon sensor histidine kinase PhoR
MKLRSRLLILVIIALCITAVCCIFAATKAFKTTLTQSTSTELAAQCRYLAETIPELLAAAEETWPQEATDSSIDRYASALGIRITIIDVDGTVRYDSQADPAMMDNHAWRAEVRQALEIGEGESSRTSGTLETTMIYHALRIDPPQTLVPMVMRTGAPVSDISAWQTQFNQILLPLLLILLACIVIVTLLIIRHITKPIDLLAAAAIRYAAGDLSPRTLIDGPQELKQLSETLNMMASELAMRIRQLEQDKLLYSSILLSMTEGVLMVDRKQTILLANHAAAMMIGRDSMEHPSGEPASRSPTQLIGSSVFQLFRDSDLTRAIERTAAGEGPRQVTVVRYGHLHGDTAVLVGSGKERTYQVSMAAINDTQDKKSGQVVITFADITDLKHLEQIRKDFVANVSHELKTPLTAIGGFAELLANERIGEQDATKFAKIIDRNAKQMLDIINDLLLLASLENTNSSPSMSRCTLESLLDETIETIQYRADLKHMKIVKTVVDPSGDGVYANQGLLVQALVNLAVNAITYSDEGTEIRLEAKADDQFVKLSVIDHGCGIPEKDLSRIFERFYRVDKARSRSQGGTGLGLSIVKHVTVLHGGGVEVISKENVGSTFTITIPREDARIARLRARSKELYSEKA